MNRTLSRGTVHAIPRDIQQMLRVAPRALRLWEDITPLARNEWICWISSAKKSETRVRRMSVMRAQLLAGKRRPCCWAGCPHRI